MYNLISMLDKEGGSQICEGKQGMRYTQCLLIMCILPNNLIVFSGTVLGCQMCVSCQIKNIYYLECFSKKT